jgi:hypothetical protein
VKPKWVLLFLGFVACNYDVGECYVRGQEGDGAGGSIITQPSGAGALGTCHPRGRKTPRTIRIRAAHKERQRSAWSRGAPTRPPAKNRGRQVNARAKIRGSM